MSPDVLYLELVEALQAGSCPLCRLGRRASDSYLNALIYEGVTDPGLRDRLRDARGPCRRHAWRMARERGSVLGTAIIYQDIVNTLAKALETGEAAGPRWARGKKTSISRQLAPTAVCPACLLEADAVQRAAKTLLKHLDSNEVAEAYVAAGGLCLPHLQETLALAGEGSARTLAGWQAIVYRRLRDELDELIRKHDYRFAGEPVSEREAKSWERAVAAVTGEEEKRSE
jgi:hypothetical protein